ncbi:hypothetical protein IE81DRAFT_368545 [Ceraceosorus guamensis]|uniref:Uncharacterized protein n=1 Tax=Ceraceosorus guamensis TaxID=1522189 RepID=A0A316VUK4_9BASI|nr:hypothetical protein IE81DRAFT_368545 [Ceraceosorus guamensis]PWN40123.1 hypothetical protein IE81DRAFT_368545 [Ceraceosorus guamensis]
MSRHLHLGPLVEKTISCASAQFAHCVEISAPRLLAVRDFLGPLAEKTISSASAHVAHYFGSNQRDRRLGPTEGGRELGGRRGRDSRDRGGTDGRETETTETGEELQGSEQDSEEAEAEGLVEAATKSLVEVEAAETVETTETGEELQGNKQGESTLESGSAPETSLEVGNTYKFARRHYGDEVLGIWPSSLLST